MQDTGRDPVNPSNTNAQGKSVPNTLNDAQRQQYYDAFVQAEAALHSAEDGVTQAQIAYDSARQKEAADVPLAEQQLADAQRQLDALQHPTPQKLAAAEAKLAQAQAQLSQLSGGTANDVAVSQSTVEQRQAALDALMAPPAAQDLAQAEANVAQAEAEPGPRQDQPPAIPSWSRRSAARSPRSGSSAAIRWAEPAARRRRSIWWMNRPSMSM